MYLGDNSDLLMALAGTSAVIAILDSELHLVWASDSYFELLGLDRRSIGKPINDLALRAENLPFFQALEATSADGLRRTVRNDSGDYGMIFDNVISRTGDHITIEVADVTAAVRAESQQRLLHSAQEAVIEHMRELVIMIDFRQRTVVTNDPCTEAFGDFSWLSEFIASGQPVEQLPEQFPVDDPDGRLRAALDIDVQVMQTGEPFHGVLALPTLHGTRIFQMVATRWEHEGQVRGLIDLKTDITDAVEAHRERQAAKLKVASLSLVRNFAQGVAHDFGNIAQVVKGYAQLLQVNHSADATGAAVKSLNAVADRSVRLAEDISEIARIGQVPAAPVHLNQVVSDHMPHLQSASGAGVVVSFDATEDVVALANEAFVLSILDNLCENAARAMNRQGEIGIYVTRAGDRVLMQVCDNGPGLPEEVQAGLFEPFNSSAVSKAAGGTGLGLYLLNEYVTHAQGTVTVDTSRAGTTFTIALPRATVAANTADRS